MNKISMYFCDYSTQKFFRKVKTKALLIKEKLTPTQKWHLRCLKKAKVFIPYEHTDLDFNLSKEPNRVEFNLNDVSDLYKIYNNLLYNGYKPTHVYIGPKQLVDLNMMSFPPFIPYTAQPFTIPNVGTLFGLRITVIPHMDGILFV